MRGVPIAPDLSTEMGLFGQRILKWRSHLLVVYCLLLLLLAAKVVWHFLVPWYNQGRPGGDAGLGERLAVACRPALIATLFGGGNASLYDTTGYPEIQSALAP